MAGGLNLYGFADGDPLNNSDPFGLCVGPLVLVCYWAAEATATQLVAAGVALTASILATQRAVSQLIPTSGSRPSAGERRAVNDIGDATGCMTCGSMVPGTQSGNWITNHVPPTSLRIPGEPSQVGPHCKKCSDTQGGKLSQQLKKAKEGSKETKTKPSKDPEQQPKSNPLADESSSASFNDSLTDAPRQ